MNDYNSYCIICCNTTKRRLSLNCNCTQFFHKKCLEEWFLIKRVYKCPVCNKKFSKNFLKKFNKINKLNKNLNLNDIRNSNISSRNYNNINDYNYILKLTKYFILYYITEYFVRTYFLNIFILEFIIPIIEIDILGIYLKSYIIYTKIKLLFKLNLYIINKILINLNYIFTFDDGYIISILPAFSVVFIKIINFYYKSYLDHLYYVKHNNINNFIIYDILFSFFIFNFFN